MLYLTNSLRKIIKQTFLTPNRFSFAKKKREKESATLEQQVTAQKDEDTLDQVNVISSRDVIIEEKFVQKSARLYDRYLESRRRPTMCLDEYQLAYELIIERLPIFVPYHPLSHRIHANRYNYGKKTGFYVELPKDLRVDDGEYVFDDYDELNDENYPSHEITISKSERVTYREHSRLWKFTDPEIVDPHSIQNHSSNNVFLIVKEKKTQEWRFPGRVLTQKETHNDFFDTFTRQLFNKSKNPQIYFGPKQPCLIVKEQREALQAGRGIRYLSFKGISINGVVSFSDQHYEDFAWVAKPTLAKYFASDYFNRVINVVQHTF